MKTRAKGPKAPVFCGVWGSVPQIFHDHIKIKQKEAPLVHSSTNLCKFSRICANTREFSRIPTHFNQIYRLYGPNYTHLCTNSCTIQTNSCRITSKTDTILGKHAQIYVHIHEIVQILCKHWCIFPHFRDKSQRKERISETIENIHKNLGQIK